MLALESYKLSMRTLYLSFTKRSIYIKADLTVISPVIRTLVIAEMGRRWKNVG